MLGELEILIRTLLVHAGRVFFSHHDDDPQIGLFLRKTIQPQRCVYQHFNKIKEEIY